LFATVTAFKVMGWAYKASNAYQRYYLWEDMTNPLANLTN